MGERDRGRGIETGLRARRSMLFVRLVSVGAVVLAAAAAGLADASAAALFWTSSLYALASASLASRSRSDLVFASRTVGSPYRGSLFACRTVVAGGGVRRPRELRSERDGGEREVSLRGPRLV